MYRKLSLSVINTKGRFVINKTFQSEFELIQFVSRYNIVSQRVQTKLNGSVCLETHYTYIVKNKSFKEIKEDTK